MQRAVARRYPDLERNPDCTSIVNERHFARLQHLLDDARGVLAGVDAFRAATQRSRGFPGSLGERSEPGVQ